MAHVLEPAVHRSIVVVDVAGFGARHRVRADQVAIRAGLYEALRVAFTRSGAGWEECYHEDRGDGVLILVPPHLPKALLAARVPGELAAAVRAHNQVHGPGAQMRLRLALHGGEVTRDAHGWTGTALNLAFRLLEAEPLKQALSESPGTLAAIASPWFFKEVIQHAEGCDAATWRRVLVAVKETLDHGWISLPDVPYPPRPGADLPQVPEAALRVRYSLPPDTAGFTGREKELDQVIAASASTPGAVVAIDGMPGVGKTALAVRAAHLLRDQFPGRQLFIDLHAHTPGQLPVDPADALAMLLSGAGVEPRFLPGSTQERAAIWRDKMTGQRILLVLDNAASSAQVTPLLPGGANCLVLVTSRRHLGELPGPAVPVPLDVLPAEQAAKIFVGLAPRAAADSAQLEAIVRLAGFLPLAVSLLARVYARHSSWTLADLAADTEAGVLTVTAEHASVAVAFELSYRHLIPAQQRFFDLLGLHPGGTIDRYAAAALAGVDLAEAGRQLDTLHREGLLTETGYRRYGMHDLLRSYACDHAARIEPDQALGRLLDYYQYVAAVADGRLARHYPAPNAAVAPAAVPAHDDDDQALAWLRAERDNLLACLDQLDREGKPAQMIALTAATAELLRRDGPWTEAVARHLTALQAARDLGDRLGQAGALLNLGSVRRLTSSYLSAARDLEQALAIYRELGDQRGQADALACLGPVRRLASDFPRAVADLEQALASYRHLGDQRGTADVLLNLGIVRREASDFPGAVADLEQALASYRHLGDRLGQASTIMHRGIVRRETRDFPGAAADLEQSLAVFRDLASLRGQANARLHLGAVRRETGDYPGAATDLEQALATHRAIGYRRGQANALFQLGILRRKTGDYRTGAIGIEQALAIYGDLGDRGGQIAALNETGTLHRLNGELAEAVASHQQALKLAQAIGSARAEAEALVGLGRCAAASGHPARAETLLGRAHQIFQRIVGLSLTLGEHTGLAGPDRPGGEAPPAVLSPIDSNCKTTCHH